MSQIEAAYPVINHAHFIRHPALSHEACYLAAKTVISQKDVADACD
jgi:hypothetical protein